MQWDIFCRVIDNWGDLGVCWRLSRELGERGHEVRLWVDDASALAWMAPGGHARVSVHPWPQNPPPAEGSNWPTPLGDVAIEAFGCELPAAFARAMGSCKRAPVWINLEYLSAEDYVQTCHGLSSPVHHGPAAGVPKWFFYPGFTAQSGGLLRERDLEAAQAGFQRDAWLAGLGLSLRPQERVVTLFCYDNPRLGALLQALRTQPACLLLLTAGQAQAAYAQTTGSPCPGGAGRNDAGLRVHALPALDQMDFDRLLWAGDLNFVRGEDSFVRAQWAARPFVWQIYPQHDGAHEPKLEAFLQRFTHGLPSAHASRLRQGWRWWNGLPAPDASAVQLLACIDHDTAHAQAWRRDLLGQQDLVTQLTDFVTAHRRPDQPAV